MAVSLINIGNIANDGTGDDLREAFIKVNANFEELDLRQPESTTASNLGSLGQGIFASKNENDLQFKKIVAGTNITLAASSDAITINALGGLQSLTVSADSGNVSLVDGDSLTVTGGSLVSTTLDTGTNTLTIDAQTDLASDATPQLSADLDAQGNNITNAGTITGSLQGLVYGVDIRDIDDAFSNLDFGETIPNITNWIDYLIVTTDVDLGSLNSPALFDIDLGSF